MPRKFKFLGYGDRKPFSGDYDEMNHETHYFFGEGNFTVGRVYEAEWVMDSQSYPDARLVDDDGYAFVEELMFFEEVPDEDEWHLFLTEPSEDELIMMDMNAEVLEADFTG